MQISIALVDRDGRIVYEEKGQDCVSLVADRVYQQGDCVRIHCEAEAFCHVRMDAAVPQALLYLPKGEMSYAIPCGELRNAYAPQAFSGQRHLITVRRAEDYELAAVRNIAHNPLDLHQGTGAYPHVYANAETRGESVFAARNVIDGMLANHGHGEWPYESWGVDIQFDPVITLDFGRSVTVHSMGICLRADFPHDSWWTQATLTLSDGTSRAFSLEKTDAVQRIDIGNHVITWARIEKLIKKDEPAEFPALIEWEMYGTERLD